LRTLQQDQAATDREVRDRLQRAAELGARSIDQQLANWRNFKPEGVTIGMPPEISITPENRIAYSSNPAIQIASFDQGLADAEQEEQVRGDLSSAIALYRRGAHTQAARTSGPSPWSGCPSPAKRRAGATMP
jgi:hypothetical protein